MMKKRLIVVVLLLLLTGCQFPPKSISKGESNLGPGAVLYAAVDDNGDVTGELILCDIEGNEINKYSLPEVEGFQSIAFLPVRAYGIALLRRQSSNGIEHFWLDTNDDNLLLLDVDSDMIFSPSFFPSPLEFYGVFFQPNPDNIGLSLISLVNGEVTSIVDLIPDLEFPIHGEFSPDEDYLLIHSASDWIIPTDDPADFHEIEVEGAFQKAIFSSDDEEIFILTQLDQEMALVLQASDGKYSQVVYQSSDLQNLIGFVTENELLLTEAQRILIHNIETEEDTILLDDMVGFVQDFYVNLDENAFLFHIKNLDASTPEEEDIYYYVRDYGGYEASEETDLAGMKIIAFYQTAAPDWLFFTNDEVSATEIKSFPLSGGNVLDLLQFSSPSTSITLSSYISPDASAAMLYRTFDQEAEAFAIENSSDTTDYLGMGQFTVGSVSPDNEYLVYGYRENAEQLPMIHILELRNYGDMEIGPGRSPVWIMP
jgi:hypothetical protein